MNKQLMGLFTMGLLITSLIALNDAHSQEPLVIAEGVPVSTALHALPRYDHSLVMFGRQQQIERAYQEADQLRKYTKRQQAKKFLFALFAPVALKFGIMIPIAKALGFSASWSAAAVHIPISMGKKSIKMAMSKNSKRDDKTNTKQRSAGNLFLNILSLV